MRNEESTAILVAGMHRSGTSALTGALSAVGVNLGERLLSPGSDNPKGYWEHEDAVGIHERLLGALGRHWDDVRALPPDWQATDAARVATAEIIELVSRDFAQSPLWAIKDPRMCRFLPLWLAAIKQLGVRPVVLFVVRRPSEVAASIEKRNHWARPVGELLWLRHVLEAEEASRAVQRTVVVYDDLLADPEGSVSSALNKLGIHPDAWGRERLRCFVDAADRHHRHTDTVALLSAFGSIAQAAYEALARGAHGCDTWSVLRECASRFDQQWQASGAYIEAVADMAHRIRLKETAARLEVLDLSSKLNAQIRWSEQAVAIHSELRAEYQLALDAIAVGRERLAGELEGLSARVAQERRDSEASLDVLIAERDRLASELGSLSKGVAQERRDFQASLDVLIAERDHLASELDSLSKGVAQERRDFQASLDVLIAERDHLASELDSLSKGVMQERREFEAALGELRLTAARSEEERHAREERLREVTQRYEEKSEALDAVQAEVISLNSVVMQLHQSWSWKLTRPLRFFGTFFRTMSHGKR